ncbi:MAG: RNA 2',3'-cyclic phosphodiesterase [Methanomassiliicoccales archaeon]
MRAFISIDLPPALFTPVFKERIFGDRCTRVATDFHLTLLFLPNITEEKARGLWNTMDEIAGDISPFKATIKGAGAFNRRGRPGVLWFGFADGGITVKMHSDLMSKASELGIETAAESFEPHITLARFRCTPAMPSLHAFLERYRDVALGEQHVDHLHFKQSELLSGGARHTVLHTSVLRGTSSPCSTDPV